MSGNPIDSPQTEGFWEGFWEGGGEFRQWLELVANLWDASSVIVAFVAGLFIVIFRPSETEILQVLATAGIAGGILVAVGVAFVYMKREPDRIKKRVLSIENLGSLMILRILLESSDSNELWSIMELRTECQQNFYIIASLEEYDEMINDLAKRKFAKWITEDLIGLTERSRDHRNLILGLLSGLSEKDSI